VFLLWALLSRAALAATDFADDDTGHSKKKKKKKEAKTKKALAEEHGDAAKPSEIDWSFDEETPLRMSDDDKGHTKRRRSAS